LAYRMLLVDIKKGLSHTAEEAASLPSKDLMKRIIDLPDDQFKRLINDAFFKHKEEGSLFRKSEKFKLELYVGLSQSPRNSLFQVLLLSRDDWLEQTVDIVDFASKRKFHDAISSLVTPAMVNRFQRDLEKRESYHIPDKYKMSFGKYEALSNILVAKAIEDY